MKPTTFLVPILTFSALAAATSDARADWRCNERVVDVGALVLDVRARCGEPEFVEQRTRSQTVRDAKGRVFTSSSNIEEWSYKAEGNELVRTLIFEDGRLISIHVGGRAPVDRSRCERQLFPQKTTATEVLLACGEPNQRDSWVEDIGKERDDGVFVSQSRTRERWVYNFGPQRFLRIFEFTESRLKKQSTGGYGY